MDLLKAFAADTEHARRERVLAAAVTVVAALFFSWQVLSLSQHEVSQFSKYPDAALQYLNNTIAPERILDYSPLYLWLHIAAFRFLEHPLASVLWVHIAFLTATTTLLYLVLRRRFSLALSLTGTLLFLLGKSVIIYGYVLEPEPLMIFFLVAVVFFGHRTDRASGFLTGVALTLCLLTRPSFAPLVVLVPLYYLVRSGNVREAIPSIALFLVPVTIGAMAIAARNYSLKGEFSLAVMNPGTVFFYGNNPQSAGTAVAYPPVVQDIADYYAGESDYHHAVVRLMERRIGADQPRGSVDRSLVSNTLNYIADHPLRFLSLTARRAYYVFNGYRWHDLDVAWNAEQSLDAGSVPFIPFSLLSALALTGIIFGLRSYREHFLAYAVVLNQFALMSLTLTTDRQRVCMYSLLVLFAVAALSHLASRIKGWHAALPVLFALFFSHETVLMHDNRHVMARSVRVPDIVSEADRQKNDLDLTSAIGTASHALALGPWAYQNGKPSDLPVRQEDLYGRAAEELSRAGAETPSTRFDRALLLIEAQRLAEAEGLLVPLAREGRVFSPDNDRLPDPLYHLGRIALLKGNRGEAADYLRRSLVRQPGEPATLAQFACLTGESAPSDSLFRYFDEIDARFLLGRACLESGQYERAADYLGRLIILMPEHARSRILLAAALGKTGKYAEAANLYLTTTGEHPRTVMLEDMVLPLFKRWAEGRSAESWYWYGVVLRQYGRFGEALPHLRRAARAGHPKAAEELLFLQTLLQRTST